MDEAWDRWSRWTWDKAISILYEELKASVTTRLPLTVSRFMTFFNSPSAMHIKSEKNRRTKISKDNDKSHLCDVIIGYSTLDFSAGVCRRKRNSENVVLILSAFAYTSVSLMVLTDICRFDRIIRFLCGGEKWISRNATRITGPLSSQVRSSQGWENIWKLLQIWCTIGGANS